MLNPVDWLLEPFRPLAPPRHLLYNRAGGKAHFRKSGQLLFGQVRKLCDLKPQASILDIGCGPGRLAVPLTGYLTGQGRYAGIDVKDAPIEWCQKKISAKFPNFRFHWLDARNGVYAPNGKKQPIEIRFPFKESSFDTVVGLSVFTHMLPQDVTHYLGEIARVLKPGGQLYMTLFLINDESLKLLASGTPLQQPRLRQFLQNDLGCYRVIQPKQPENAVAYTEAFVRKYWKEKGLEIVEPIQFGRWCGKQTLRRLGQDVVLARKPRV